MSQCSIRIWHGRQGGTAEVTFICFEPGPKATRRACYEGGRTQVWPRPGRLGWISRNTRFLNLAAELKALFLARTLRVQNLWSRACTYALCLPRLLSGLSTDTVCIIARFGFVTERNIGEWNTVLYSLPDNIHNHISKTWGVTRGKADLPSRIRRKKVPNVTQSADSYRHTLLVPLALSFGGE